MVYPHRMSPVWVMSLHNKNHTVKLGRRTLSMTATWGGDKKSLRTCRPSLGRSLRRSWDQFPGSWWSCPSAWGPFWCSPPRSWRRGRGGGSPLRRRGAQESPAPRTQPGSEAESRHSRGPWCCWAWSGNWCSKNRLRELVKLRKEAGEKEMILS